MEQENLERAIRFVTARELSRHTSDLLDAIEGGVRVVVTRHGVPVVMMEASKEMGLLQKVRLTAPVEAFQEPEEDIELESFDLPADGWRVLDALSRSRSVSEVISQTGLTWGEVALSLTSCEVHRLAGRLFGGRYVVTELGERALKAWKERD